MGMNTRVIGFISPENETYKKQVSVLKACIDAGISELPKETADFFGCKFAEEYLIEDKLISEISAHEYSADMQNGFEIIISELPKEIYKIRFVNSY